MLEIAVGGGDHARVLWKTLTAGASAPDILVRGVLDRLRELGAASVRELHGEPEDMVFALPKELRLRLVD